MSYIIPGSGGEVLEIPDIPQFGLPPRDFFINGLTFLQNLCRRRNFFISLALVSVRGTNPDGLKLTQHIHLGQGDAGETV